MICPQESLFQKRSDPHMGREMNANVYEKIAKR